MRTKSRFSSLVLLTVAGYSYPALAQTDDPLLASIRKSGEVKVALGSAPPWMFVSPSGEPKGYLLEVMNLALKRMSLPAMTPVLIGWDAQIPALQAGQVNLVAPGLQYTEARCKVVVFSGPTGVQRDALYVPSGNPKHLTGYADVARSPEIKLAVVAGSSAEAYALKRGIKPAQLVRVPDLSAGVATISGTRADAFAMGQFSIPKPEQKGLEAVVDKEGPLMGYGVVFRKEDVHFRDAFDKQLDVLRSNGTMKELYEKYGALAGLSADSVAGVWDVLSKVHKVSDVEPSCE